MFAFSNLQVIEQLAFNVVQLGSLGLHPPDKSTLLLNIRLSENVFGRANYFMSDAIVVWRAWVLWQDSLGVKVLLSLCLCGTFVGLTVNMTFGTLWLYGNERFNPSGPRSLILVLPLMFTNIVSTTLIGIRAWSYRKHIKQVLSLPRNRKTNVERILIILTESGAIYCLFWIPFLYICLTTDVDSIGYKIVANMLPQLSAIYPVIIVLLVTMEKTQLEATMSSAVTETLHFVTRPAVAGTNMNLSAAGEDCFGNPRSQSSGTAGDRDDDDEDSKEKEMGKGKGD
ncbi:hypothetical protein R3P38DRAFT_3023886 [Favolaschia claudopus]|uniref:Uncharacterized protein n=1 Tax=Favolaschia claudopus TaxID=2862362 RepID=A0AAW0AGK6_9AGAR